MEAEGRNPSDPSIYDRVAVVKRSEAHSGSTAAISYGRGQLSAKSVRVDT